jgi:hypothetical protein
LVLYDEAAGQRRRGGRQRARMSDSARGPFLLVPEHSAIEQGI